MYASLVTEYTTYTHMAVCSPACSETVKTLYRWTHGGKVHLKKKESQNGDLCDLKKKKLSKSLHEEQTVGFTSIQTSSLSLMTSVFSAAAHRILTLPPVTDTTCRQSAALC